MKPLPRLFALPVLVLVALAAPIVAAVETATGTVRGRIMNLETGEYLTQARVRVKSAPGAGPAAAALETFSDDLGVYRLAHVPAGPVVLEAFYTGLAAEERALSLAPGAEVELDLALRPSAVKLEAFTVAASREISATALAVNSQRFAPNTRSVVAVDELGFTGDGSVAGAMKFLPGVDLEPDAFGYGNGITLSGAPSANVPVTYGGFDVMTSADLVQNASGNQNQRTANLMQLSLANISRIEVNRSPTPDTPGSALAGSVNFVPKSAFERSRPSYEIQVFGSANENELTLRRTSGPLAEKRRPLYPGLALSAIVPLSKRFGFSLTLSRNETPKRFDHIVREKTANWNPATGTFRPTPSDPEHYMLYAFEVQAVTGTYTRESANLTADWKLGRDDMLTASLTLSDNEQLSGQRQIRWTIDRLVTSLDTVNSTLTATQTVPNPPTNASVLNNTYSLDTADSNRQFQLRYRHDGRVWTAEAGASYGDARKTNHDLDRGYAFSSLFNLTRTDIQLADIGEWTVGRITAARGGAAVTPMDLRTFAAAGYFTSTVAGTSPAASITSSLPPVRTKPTFTADRKSQVNASLARTFDFRWPLAVKLGLDASDYHRDQAYDPFLGTNSGGFVYDGTDVPITDFFTAGYDTPVPGGYGIPTTIDNAKLARFFRDHRNRFVQITPGNDYQTAVSNSKFLHESITAGFIRLDSRFLHNRLWIVYGVRYEDTTDEGQGPRNDPTGNYRRNAAGQFVDAAGVPVPAGRTPALLYTAGSLPAAQATWFTRQSRARRSYDNLFPSLNASYNATEDIVARLSYSQTIGRPDIYNIAPGLTLPDPTAVAPRIVLTNPGISPWTSRNLSASLEYYSKNLGDITLRGYRRYISDAFASQIVSAAESREIVELYGLDLNDYPATTTVQMLRTVPGRVVTSGLELSSRYQLDAFLPAWAHGVQVKFSAGRSTFSGGGAAATAFAAQNLYLVPYSVGAGLSLTRARFSLGANAKWNDRQRLGYIDPASDASGAIEPGTYEYLEAAWRIDLDATLRLGKRLSLFINGRDVGGYTRTLLRFGPNTPSLLKGRQRDVFQPVWTLGLRASY